MSAARAIARARSATPAGRVPASRREAEREADRVGEEAARRPPVAGWSFASVPPSPPHAAVARRDAPDDPQAAAAVGGPGRPLEPATRREFEIHLGADLSAVRLHDDPAAAAATRATGAEGLALGDDVALAVGRHDPASPRGRALLAHELAHVVQQRAAGSAAAVQRNNGGTVTPATTLDALPEADRKRIQIVTAQVTVPGIAEKFATTGTTVTSAFPGGASAAFDTSVDAALQHGLTNVAGALSAGVELTPAPLPPNSTATLELDVPGKGKGLYRFTYHAPPAPPGGKAAAPAPRIVVEALGKATAPPGTKAPPPPATTGAPPAPDPVADKIKKHSLKQSYAGAELDALRAALDQIPDAQLSIVDGLAFDRKQADPTDPKVGGHYDPKTHTVTMFDRAFSSTQTRAKAAGTTTSDESTREIVHEIGHAIDLAPMRKAGVEKDKADAAVAGLPAKYPDPSDATKFQFKKGTDEEKDVKATLKAQQDAETAVLSARSLSGSKTIKKPGGDFEDVIGTTAAGNKFREAAAKDGGKAVSAYGDTDFQEAFAEAYSLYITSPDTLKSLRPNVFDFLDKNLPK